MSAHGFQNPSEFPPPAHKAASPPRPKHQTHRSITDVSGASFPKLHRPHAHHHGHMHRHKESKDKSKEFQSSHVHTQGGRNVWAGGASRIESSKSEGVTPEQSRGPSRRTSIMGRNDEQASFGDGAVEERKVVKEGELEAEMEKGVLRATELRNALSSLNTLSNNTTRRLDNTYYSVLEKLSVLQSTISSMKELAAMTKQLNEEFLQDSEEVVLEVETSLDAFGGFEKHKKQIEELAAKVAVGRSKIKNLVGRVDVVKQRVAGWEKSEVEWQERTRQRLRILWIIIAIGGFFFTGLMVFQMTPARTQGPGVIKGWNASLVGGTVPGMKTGQNETFSLTRHTADKLEKTPQEEEVLEDEPRLRIFDEL